MAADAWLVVPQTFACIRRTLPLMAVLAVGLFGLPFSIVGLVTFEVLHGTTSSDLRALVQSVTMLADGLAYLALASLLIPAVVRAALDDQQGRTPSLERCLSAAFGSFVTMAGMIFIFAISLGFNALVLLLPIGLFFVILVASDPGSKTMDALKDLQGVLKPVLMALPFAITGAGWIAAWPSVVAERMDSAQAIDRGLDLAKGRWAGLFVLMYLFAFISHEGGALLAATGKVFWPEGWINEDPFAGPAPVAAASAFLSSLLLTFGAVGATTIYLQLRSLPQSDEASSAGPDALPQPSAP